MQLSLDHVSLRVPALGPALAALRDRLGLLATPTPAAPNRHARIYFDRGYLEIAAEGESALPYFFLRFAQLEDTLETLSRNGIVARASLYEGVDGTWEDVTIHSPVEPMPFLIRRIAPVEVAADWPPAQSEPHPCGAEALVAVHLCVPRLKATRQVYSRLLGTPALESNRAKAVYPVGDGRIVLHEGMDRAAGILGFGLRVSSLETTSRYLSQRGTKTWRLGDALWTELPGGGLVGFYEQARVAFTSEQSYEQRSVYPCIR